MISFIASGNHGISEIAECKNLSKIDEIIKEGKT